MNSINMKDTEASLRGPPEEKTAVLRAFFYCCMASREVTLERLKVVLLDNWTMDLGRFERQEERKRRRKFGETGVFAVCRIAVRE